MKKQIQIKTGETKEIDVCLALAESRALMNAAMHFTTPAQFATMICATFRCMTQVDPKMIEQIDDHLAATDDEFFNRQSVQ